MTHWLLYSLPDENFSSCHPIKTYHTVWSIPYRTCTKIASQMIFICDQPREKLFEIDDLLDIESYPIDRQMEKLWDGNFFEIFNFVKNIKRQLNELASRELRLRQREHKPIKSLLKPLQAAHTATVSDLYFLFTKARMKFRPR